MDWITTFWEANRNNIIVSFISGLVFFILGPIGLWFSGKKVKKERINKAKDTLLDIMEGMLVSEEKVSHNKLIMIFRSVERDLNVDLEANYDLENLFGDLVLRFERSKHLDANQKDNYFEKIVNMEAELITGQNGSSNNQSIPKAYSKVLNEIREANTRNDQQTIDSLLNELEHKLNSRDTMLGSNMLFLRKPKILLLTLFIYILFLIIIFTLISFVDGKLPI